MKNRTKVWIFVYFLAGFIAFLGAVFYSEFESELLRKIAGIGASVLGGSVILKILIWDWKEAKKNSKDKSFRLRK
ncbi:MAG TPA: hypothetical protein EYO40_04515 [Phycisphaerales bacterium]|nr:hypothetical protein [Phycisphaerales bacterium]